MMLLQWTHNLKICPSPCLKCKRWNDVDLIASFVLWVWPVKLSFAAVTSRGDNHEQSGLLTDAACNLHISVGVEPANQSRAPIAAHAYHLHTAAAAPPREWEKRMERKERKSKNEWCAWERGWFVLCRSTFMPASFFYFTGFAFWRHIFLVTVIHICHFRGMNRKIIVFVVISAASA